MPSSFSLPSDPSSFVGLPGPTKTRVFLVSQRGSSAADVRLEQVATLAAPPEQAAAVIAALNQAAWTGDRSVLDAALGTFPDAIGQSFRQALDRCPSPDSLVLGYDDRPMQVVKTLTFTGDVADLSLHAAAAYDIGLQLLIHNTLNEDGELEFVAALMNDEKELFSHEVASWWPTPPGSMLLERLTPRPDELESTFSDPRWRRNVGRAYWLFVRDDNNASIESWSSTAEWIVEFWDSPLVTDPAKSFTFVPDLLPPEMRGPLTPRTRFLLWQSLVNVAVDLDGMLAEAIDDSIVRDDLLPLAGEQPREWWEQLHQASKRLCEAARTAALNDLTPQTPAEEALVFLAASDSYVDWARDNLEDPVVAHQHDRLPHLENDEMWDELLDDLVGDDTVEEVWENAARSASPQEVLRRVRSGRYNPDLWHVALPHM